MKPDKEQWAQAILLVIAGFLILWLAVGIARLIELV